MAQETTPARHLVVSIDGRPIFAVFLSREAGDRDVAGALDLAAREVRLVGIDELAKARSMETRG